MKKLNTEDSKPCASLWSHLAGAAHEIGVVDRFHRSIRTFDRIDERLRPLAGRSANQATVAGRHHQAAVLQGLENEVRPACFERPHAHRLFAGDRDQPLAVDTPLQDVDRPGVAAQRLLIGPVRRPDIDHRVPTPGRKFAGCRRRTPPRARFRSSALSPSAARRRAIETLELQSPPLNPSKKSFPSGLQSAESNSSVKVDSVRETPLFKSHVTRECRNVDMRAPS